MQILKTVTDTYNSLQPHTKRLMHFCGMYLYAICLCAAAIRICAGRLMDYYTALFLCRELLETLRPCIGVTALGAILFEIPRQKE